MKTRTKILSVLVALLPAALATVAVKLEAPPEYVQLGETTQVAEAVIEIPEVTIRPDRTFSEAVKYELGLKSSETKPVRRHHRHHRHHNVSFQTPVAGVGAHKPGTSPTGAAPCTRRDGITICDPKALTRTRVDRKPRRSRGWYLPERKTQSLEPFGSK